LSDQTLHSRKLDHIKLAFQSQLAEVDHRFYYEPLFEASPDSGIIPPMQLAGKIMRYPLWISSMTGGAELAGEINRNLAVACKEYGLGMGLGSCRPVLVDPKNAADFAVRKYIGNQPLYANLGIAQLEELYALGHESKIGDLVDQLEADGLIVHVNPLQEWFQPEGDRYKNAPIDTIKRVLDKFHFPIMVKEVGQGFGPRSLRALLDLPLEAVDFGAFGGTNFSLLENLRRTDVRSESWKCATHIGHSAEEMSNWICEWNTEKQVFKAKSIIVSGGIKSFLDGYYFLKKIPQKTMYAHASLFLKYALLGEQELLEFTESQIQGLEMAQTYLTLKK